MTDTTALSALPFADGLLREMSATSDLLVGVRNLNEVLGRLAHRARDLTGADFAAISTFDDDDKLERFVYAGVDEREAEAMGHPPTGRGLLGVLVKHEWPILLDDLQTDPRFTGWPAQHPDMTAFLGVPIRAGGRTIGSLYMTRMRGKPPFAPEAEVAASFMAMQAAVSVSMAMAREQNDRVHLLEERGRIAHDLHDGTIQALYALGLQVDALRHAPDISAVADEGLAMGVAQINQLISDIRTYIQMLESETPPSAPELSRDLAFVVQRLVPSGVNTVLQIAPAAASALTPRDVEDLVYVSREALSNAVRHGSPTKVAVDLRADPRELALTIQDNGVGYDPSTARVGLGTVTMRTRAERLGGQLWILSIPGMGTTVRVTIPREVTNDGDD
ncbi:MAG: GAF domain-containing protein [Dehalococcoidia bacterium]